MKTEQWYKNLVDRIKDTLEYRFESLLLDITESICRKMKEKNISRSKLAEKLNISRPAVTRMLDGNPNFTLKRLLAVTDALDLDLSIEFKERYRDKFIFEDCNKGTTLFESESDIPSALGVKPKKQTTFEAMA